MNGNEPDSDWDPVAPETLDDPHDTYAELRGRCPVAYSRRWGGFWTLTRYEDILAATADARTFISSIQNIVPSSPKTGPPRIPLAADPPLHTQYRRALNPYFEAKRIELLEPPLRGIAARLLVPTIAKGRAELMKEFAGVYPVLALCAFLGLDDDEADLLAERSRRYVRAIQSSDRETSMSISEEMDAYARRIVAGRKASPRDRDKDVVSGLLASDMEGRRPEDELLAGVVRLLLIGGHTVVANFIGSAVRHLAADAGLQDELRWDGTKIPSAIQELLRLYSPNQALARTPTRDVEIRGRKIRAGQPVAMLYISANRDADVFPEPDKFILSRPSDKHLAFGHGIHKCVGRAFAELQVRLALEELLSRTKHFELDGPYAKSTWPEFGVQSLPLRFRI